MIKCCQVRRTPKQKNGNNYFPQNTKGWSLPKNGDVEDLDVLFIHSGVIFRFQLLVFHKMFFGLQAKKGRLSKEKFKEYMGSLAICDHVAVDYCCLGLGQIIAKQIQTCECG